MSAAISLRNVAKHYRRGKEAVEVLHGLNLEIPAGEFVSLMGPSGQHNKTIVMVTHDPKAADHATRQLEMDKGSLVTRAAAAA